MRQRVGSSSGLQRELERSSFGCEVCGELSGYGFANQPPEGTASNYASSLTVGLFESSHAAHGYSSEHWFWHFGFGKRGAEDTESFLGT